MPSSTDVVPSADRVSPARVGSRGASNEAAFHGDDAHARQRYYNVRAYCKICIMKISKLLFISQRIGFFAILHRRRRDFEKYTRSYRAAVHTKNRCSCVCVYGHNDAPGGTGFTGRRTSASTPIKSNRLTGTHCFRVSIYFIVREKSRRSLTGIPCREIADESIL